jgi:hypothetical protein
MGYATHLLILNNNMIQIVTAQNIKGVALESELIKSVRNHSASSVLFFNNFLSF